MHIEHVTAFHVFAHLAHGRQEWLVFDIANGTTGLDDYHIRVGMTGDVMPAIFNFVGDVRDNLNSATQVFSAALLANDSCIDLASSHIIGLAGWLIGKTLIVAEVKIGLCSIIGDKDFAMLVG